MDVFGLTKDAKRDIAKAKLESIRGGRMRLLKKQRVGTEILPLSH